MFCFGFWVIFVKIWIKEVLESWDRMWLKTRLHTGSSIYDVRTRGWEGGPRKAHKVRDLRKRGCVKRDKGGGGCQKIGTICGRHKWKVHTRNISACTTLPPPRIATILLPLSSPLSPGEDAVCGEIPILLHLLTRPDLLLDPREEGTCVLELSIVQCCYGWSQFDVCSWDKCQVSLPGFDRTIHSMC